MGLKQLPKHAQMEAKHVQLSASPLSGSMMTTKKDTKEHNIATTPKSIHEDCIYGMVEYKPLGQPP